ncbi:methyl-accepting chemotaxis protein [Halomonas sp. YLGW01]|uniref:methyl-accepting chemotaxis protein n=1 Tax=Halomonas sp. YLGW01 TaxID=2773308 RepID=UPI001786AF6A|nr:methyl-accepting chemotaxis protein [Halomonas sp. YLGW01]
MRFKSLRSFVTLLVGTCILIVVAALVSYAMMANSRSQTLVEARTGELLRENARERLMALAEAQSQDVQRRLERALLLAEQLADTNALMGQRDEDGQARVVLSRYELSNLARNLVVQNPDLLDAFIGWEPNAFGNDAVFTGKTDEGYDGSGRFMPWWYRNGEGEIEVLPLGDTMESETRDDQGLRNGEYYLCPRETERTCIIDPRYYDYNGQRLLVTSFNAPILVDGDFRGVAGVDLGVDFIQGWLEKANADLYDGAGSMALMASRGVMVGSTGHPGKLGQSAEAVLGDALAAQLNAAQQSGVQYAYNVERERFELTWPFTIGGSEETWVLSIRLPEQVVMAGLIELRGQLAEKRQADLVGMALMGLVIALLGLLAIWMVGGSIARPLRQLAERMGDIASGEGDLTARLPVRGRNEAAELATQFNAFVAKMNDVLLDVRDSSESVRIAATEIADGGQDLSRRTENAASSLQQTSASMEEITSTVEHTAESSRQANGLSESASQVARRGGEAVGQVVDTMQGIRDSAAQISEIVTVMDGIAFQTNLLALNASVEAARAGEQGRGFAVVAGEVRQLASRSASAAKQIKGLIDTSSARTEEGAAQVRAAGETMEEIVQSVTRVTDVLGEITAATGEQSDGIGQVNVAVSELDRMTQQNAALVEESTTAAEQLKDQADRLAEAVAGFTLREKTERPALASPGQR